MSRRRFRDRRQRQNTTGEMQRATCGMPHATGETRCDDRRCAYHRRRRPSRCCSRRQCPQRARPRSAKGGTSAGGASATTNRRPHSMRSRSAAGRRAATPRDSGLTVRAAVGRLARGASAAAARVYLGSDQGYARVDGGGRRRPRPSRRCPSVRCCVGVGPTFLGCTHTALHTLHCIVCASCRNETPAARHARQCVQRSVLL
jgi:hypothetical protein